MRCKAKTKNDTQCKNNSVKNSDYCFIPSHKSQKPTAAEKELRILTITEMILKGESRQDIVRYSSEKWSISERTVDNYLSESYDKIEESSKNIRENLVEISIARLNDLYKMNYAIQDYRECRQVQESINKISGAKKSSKDSGSSKGSKKTKLKSIGGKNW